MANTIDAFDIGRTWTNLNTLTGISAGTQISVQCVGFPGDAIHIAISDTEPPAEFIGVRLVQNDPAKTIPELSDTVWVRFERLDRSPVQQTTKLQVQLPNPIAQTVNIGSPQNYYSALADGLINGASSGAIVASHTFTSTAYVDIWQGSSNYSWPTALESLEVLSSSALDTVGGAGLGSVVIFALDDNFNELAPIVVNLNGTTPVALPVQVYRINGMVGLDGSQGSNETNAGTITLRRIAGQLPRRYIPIGTSISRDLFYTVPANKRLKTLNVTYYYDKDQSGSVRGLVRLPNGLVVESGVFPAYQNQNIIDFVALFPAQPGTDVWFQANSQNPSGSISMSFEYELREI